LPEHVVTNAELTARFTALGKPTVIDRLACSTGITNRFYVPDDWVTSDIPSDRGNATAGFKAARSSRFADCVALLLPNDGANCEVTDYKAYETRPGTPLCRPQIAAETLDLANEALMDKRRFDDSDYSVVVKNKGSPPNSWKWEIYRAGRSNPIGQSPIFFHTVAAANKAGKAALKQLLNKLNT
jgi:hypothetical protein